MELVRYHVRTMSITSTVIERAETRFVQAAEPLQPFVGCFWVITAEQGAVICIVPDGSTSISIQCVDGRRANWFLRGPVVRPEVRRFRSAGTLIGVRLRPGVAHLVTGTPAAAIVGRRMRLQGPSFAELTLDARCPRTPEQRIDTLQHVLLERLVDVHVPEVVSRAVAAIERADGCVRVADVAASCGVSPRQLNRLMRVWVGYGAKRLALVVRFQSTLRQIEQAPRQSVAALASETGYFDQAHLSLDTGRLAGATPRHLASRAADFYKTRCDAPL